MFPLIFSTLKAEDIKQIKISLITYCPPIWSHSLPPCLAWADNRSLLIISDQQKNAGAPRRLHLSLSLSLCVNPDHSLPQFSWSNSTPLSTIGPAWIISKLFTKRGIWNFQHEMDIYQQEDQTLNQQCIECDLTGTMGDLFQWASQPWQFRIVGSSVRFVKICSHSDRLWGHPSHFRPRGGRAPSAKTNHTICIGFLCSSTVENESDTIYHKLNLIHISTDFMKIFLLMFLMMQLILTLKK